MPRPKEFDPDSVLEHAAMVFWKHGYRGTSVAMLESALNIGRKSLYDTFGDKRGLFLAILDQYLELPYPVAQQNSSWPAVKAMLLQGPHFDPELRSCLFANTILELGDQGDRALQERAERHLRRMESLFKRALMRAQTAGEISAETNINLASKLLTTTLQGFSVMAKGSTSQSSMRTVAKAILTSIEHGRV